jgi:hypothetical protein
MIRSTLLRLHARLNPGHVIVGWYGKPLRCGTCLGLPNPENGLPRHLLPRSHPDRRSL